MQGTPETETALRAALQHYERGEFHPAEQLCLSVLESQPRNPDALHLLGVVAFRTSRRDDAARLIAAAVEINPRAAGYRNTLGTVLREQGKPAEAASQFEEAVRLSPDNALAHNNLGLALRDLGRVDEAVAAYREALRLNPAYAAARNHLGIALQDAGDFEAAIICFRQALQGQPGFAEAHNNLGYALQRTGRGEEAVRCYGEALRLKPGFAEAYNNLGTAFQDFGRAEEALAAYGQAIRLSPGYVKAHLNAGHALREQGKGAESVRQFRHVLSLQPDLAAARWGECVAEIPCFYETEQEIFESRARYESALERLSGALPLSTPSEIAAAADAVGSAQPFYLPFQCLNDRELQARYGMLVARIQSARYPQWAAPRAARRRPRGEPIRVGIVSAFFHRHSNWKAPIRGWVENLDRSRFALHGYYTGRKKDGATELARRAFGRFVEDVPSIEALCAEIERDCPDVLIYPEVGMDPTTLRLAALRLAPVQCTSWGHPDTSGLPTMDYFLSSELMEPPEGEAHYTEQLVRLPNLSLWYTPPEIEVPPMDRAEAGIRESAVVFSCVHSVLTYLPQFDEVFVRIAREAGDCQFVFLAFSKSAAVGDRFRSRLERAFERGGLKSGDYLVFLPHLDEGRFQAVQKLCDVLLDSIGWSACNTTLEAITWDLPVVTLPGSLMRGRHTHGILSMMGVTGTIASSVDEYVGIAVRLARDAGFRSQVREQIALNKHKIYRDGACIGGLEEFLQHAVELRGLR